MIEDTINAIASIPGVIEAVITIVIVYFMRQSAKILLEVTASGTFCIADGFMNSLMCFFFNNLGLASIITFGIIMTPRIMSYLR